MDESVEMLFHKVEKKPLAQPNRDTYLQERIESRTDGGSGDCIIVINNVRLEKQ